MLILEFFDGELEGDSYGQGESFGDSHDDDGDCNDESLGDVSNVLSIREVTRSEGPDIEHESESEGQEYESS